MAGNQLTSSSIDTNTLFKEVVHNASTGDYYLGTYGPVIEVWPSGYSTLGFGPEKSDAPAAALAIATVGGLAVRASAGGTDAASVLNSRSTQAALSLHSLTMHSALEAVGRGQGVIPALALAVNITDINTSPSMHGILFDKGGLQAILGESVNDPAATSGKAAAVNALYYKSGREVALAAKEAVTSYTRRYYGKAIPDERVLIHAYAALALRTNAIADPESPNAQIWLGAVVEAGSAMAKRLADGESSLLKILQPDCFAVYEEARGAGFRHRPAGAVVSQGGGSLPSRNRTLVDARKLGMTRGIGSGVATVENTDAVTPGSYTDRRASEQLGGLDRKYTDLITRHLQEYVTCVGEVAEQRAMTEAARQRVKAGLGRLYAAYPYLKPENLVLTRRCDERIFTLLEQGNAAAAERSAVEGANAQSLRERMANAAAGIAAASLLQNVTEDGRSRYQRLVQNPHVTDYAAAQLINNRNLFYIHGPGGIDDGFLRENFRITSHEAQRASRQSTLNDVPLNLLVLATDIVAENHRSVMNIGHTPRVRTPEAQFNPETREFKDSVVGRTRQAAHDRATERKQREWEADRIVNELRNHLSDRYNVEIRDGDAVTTGFLAECAIAERLGFGSGRTPEHVELAIAQRIRQAAERDPALGSGGRRLDLGAMPPNVLNLYHRAAQIAGAHASPRGLLGRLRKGDSEEA